MRTRCVKIRRFYLKTENSVQQKSCIKEIINFKRSWFHGHTTHLKDKTKSRTVTVNLPTVEVHKQPPVSLASLYGSALHSILTSIKNIPTPRPYVRTILVSTKISQEINLKPVTGTQTPFITINKPFYQHSNTYS